MKPGLTQLLPPTFAVAQIRKRLPFTSPALLSRKMVVKLPQTASPLPLLGLLGFGSVLTGIGLRAFRKGR